VRLYIDANPIIYAYEAEPPLRNAALAWLAKVRFDPSISLITSWLTRMEVRCQPIRLGQIQLLNLYESFFENPSLYVVSVSDSVVEAATLLRARRAGAADAIHIATAIENGCDAVLTKDADWKKFFPGRVFVVGIDQP
jgi:predicted nucleic acid-binding protein